MKKIAIAAACLLVAFASAHASPRRQNPQRQLQREQSLQPGGRNAVRPNANNRPPVRRNLLREAIFSFYVKQLQQDGEIAPDVFTNKIIPYLQQFLDERFEISERHDRALRQLRQAVNRSASEDEFKQFVRELDSADADFQANHEKFYKNVDPLLNPRQQAKLRILQNMADNQIRQLLNEVQNPNPQRPAAGQPPEK